jgi:hypothetical protein
MRIQLILLLCFWTQLSFADRDKEMRALFDNYERVVKYHQVELISDVFTEKFLKENGGIKEFEAKIKEQPKAKAKKGLKKMLQKWRESKVRGMFFAKVQNQNSGQKQPSQHSPQFIVVEEKGKLKIDGTISDDD